MASKRWLSGAGKVGLALFAATVLCLGTGCDKMRTRYEYKVVSVGSEGHQRTGAAGGKYASVNVPESGLNEMGQDGWEMVSSYLEMETAWTNFGNEGYVTGIQPNVRPQRVVMIFKRKIEMFAKAKS